MKKRLFALIFDKNSYNVLVLNARSIKKWFYEFIMEELTPQPLLVPCPLLYSAGISFRQDPKILIVKAVIVFSEVISISTKNKSTA